MDQIKVTLSITATGFEKLQEFERSFLLAAGRNRHRVMNMRAMQELIFTIREQIYQPEWDYIEPEGLVLNKATFKTLEQCVEFRWMREYLSPLLLKYLEAKITEGHEQLEHIL